MQIIAKKGVKIFRDFYIDMEVKPPFLPNTLKVPVSYIGETVTWKKTIGDTVSKFDEIAVTKNGIPIYSPASGVLREITVGPEMGEMPAIQYAVLDTVSDNIPAHPLWETDEVYTKEKLFEIIKKAAIINETTGDYFINSINPATKYNKVLVDCIDEQPYDLSRTSVFLSYKNEVIGGAKILAAALGIPEIEILIMKNFRTANIFKERYENIKVIKAGGKYPIFPETVQYAHTCTGLLAGAQCLRALYRAAYFGEPQLSSVVSVWGEGVEEPCNFEVLNGTPIKELLEHCKAFGILERVVAGGVMKGYAASLEWPLLRHSGALTVMPLKKHHRTLECINCGRCASVCPMKLAPYYILRSSKKPGENMAKQLCTGMCIYCGACSYICPARIPLKEKILKYNNALRGGVKK